MAPSASLVQMSCVPFRAELNAIRPVLAVDGRRVLDTGARQRVAEPRQGSRTSSTRSDPTLVRASQTRRRPSREISRRE